MKIDIIIYIYILTWKLETVFGEWNSWMVSEEVHIRSVHKSETQFDKWHQYKNLKWFVYKQWDKITEIVNKMCF